MMEVGLYPADLSLVKVLKKIVPVVNQENAVDVTVSVWEVPVLEELLEGGQDGARGIMKRRNGRR